jgi:hypothetical protein
VKYEKCNFNLHNACHIKSWGRGAMTLVLGIQYSPMLEVDMLENRCTPSTMVASTFTPQHNLPIACNKTQLPLCRTCNHLTIMHHSVNIMGCSRDKLVANDTIGLWVTKFLTTCIYQALFTDVWLTILKALLQRFEVLHPQFKQENTQLQLGLNSKLLCI